MEFSLRPYHAYVTAMVRSCHVGEDRTMLLTCSSAFVVGSHSVFAMSRDLSVNTRIIFSKTHLRFNNDIVKMSSVQNSELLLLLCLPQEQQARLDEQALGL